MYMSRNVCEIVCEKMLILPSVRYIIKKLSVFFPVNDGDNLCGHVAYLKSQVELLKPQEKHIIFMIDEIHVRPKSTYKGGNLKGMAVNNTNVELSTVQTFMFCSLIFSNKDVAAMIPVKNLDAQFLKQCTLKVIEMFENMGYCVLCLISDNNRINRNMFTAICKRNLRPFFNQFNAERKLFFLFDSVPLLRGIKIYIWIGQLVTTIPLYVLV